MTIGIHVSVTNPEKNRFPWKEAIQSYLNFADEVIVVDGASNDGSLEKLLEWEKREKKLKVIISEWPKGDFDYSEFPKHLNIGYKTLSTDWKIKVDVDYVIHEDTYVRWRKNLSLCPKNRNLTSYGKLQITNREKMYFKVNVPFCIRANDNIAYGKVLDKDKGDWAYPIYWDGKLKDNGVPVGLEIPASDAFILGVNVWNYNYFFRTKEEIMNYFWRYAKAYNKYHKDKFGETKEQAFLKFLSIERGRIKKVQFYDIEIKDHPKVMHGILENLQSNQYGFNNWGMWDFYNNAINI